MKLSEIDPDLSVHATPYSFSCSSGPTKAAVATPSPLPLARSAETSASLVEPLAEVSAELLTSKPCPLPPCAPCPHLLVIAYGNTLRRDDGAGIGLAGILVKRWRACGINVRYIVVPQLAPELTSELADLTVTGVVFVDAAQAEPPLAIAMQAIQVDLATPAISHYLDPAGLLLYAHLLEGRSVPAWMVSVPGVDFEYGEGFSRPAHELLQAAPQLALEFLARIREHTREQVQHA